MNLGSEWKKIILLSQEGVQDINTVGIPKRIKADLSEGGSGRAEAGWDGAWVWGLGLGWGVITLLCYRDL